MARFYGRYLMKLHPEHALSQTLRMLAIAPALVSLAACGGSTGGGGGVNTIPPPPPAASFSSFSNVTAGTAIDVPGSTREGTLSVSANGTILPGNVSSPTEGTGSVRFTANSARQITALTVTGAQSNVSFDSSSPATSILVDGVAVATALSNSSGSNQAIYVDPYAVGFNYQSYGVWGSNIVAGSGGRYGAISAGATTAASSIPTSGTTTFRGSLAGIYVDTNGITYRYAAIAAFVTNFSTRSIAMSTSGDGIANITTDASRAFGSSVAGTLTYSAGSNAFSGSIAAGSLMSGTASGSFYGPSANELGGTFFMRGSAGALVGGFGAK